MQKQIYNAAFVQWCIFELLFEIISRMEVKFRKEICIHYELHAGVQNLKKLFRT